MDNQDVIDLLLSSQRIPPEEPSLGELYSRLNRLRKVKTVFRIENDRGDGPYTVTDQWCIKDHKPSNGRPTPNSDDGFCVVFKDSRFESIRCGWFDVLIKKAYDERIKFGFSSMKQLHRWFHDHQEFINLNQLGFKIKFIIMLKVTIQDRKLFL